MATRPQGSKTAMLSADGVIKAEGGVVFSFAAASVGATVGDLAVLRDGGPEGEIKAYAVIGAANGMTPFDCGPYGIEFSSSIYYSEAAAAAGKIRGVVVYD